MGLKLSGQHKFRVGMEHYCRDTSLHHRGATPEYGIPERPAFIVAYKLFTYALVSRVLLVSWII